MLKAECINTNALANLERETGQTGLAEEHMTAVPRWIANINAAVRLGVLAVAIGLIINFVLMVRHIRIEKKSGQIASGDS